MVATAANKKAAAATESSKDEPGAGAAEERPARQLQQAIDPSLRDAELEELGIDLIEANAAQAVAREKRKLAYQAVKSAMMERKLSEYPMIDRLKTLVAKGRDVEIQIKDRDVDPPR